MADSGSSYVHYVGGIIRRGGEILTVRQSHDEGSSSWWSLPQGRVEEAETLQQALAREILEETGLAVVDVGVLAYSAQGRYPAEVGIKQSTAYVFEVNKWEGEISPSDSEVVETEFASPAQVLSRLQQLPPSMKDPLCAYLRGEVGWGSIWYYTSDESGEEVLATRQP